MKLASVLLFAALVCTASAAPVNKYGMVKVSSPATVPDATEIVAALFKALGVSADASTCVSDSTTLSSDVRDFAADLKAQRWSDAVSELGTGMTALSTAIHGCNVPQLTTKLDALAASIKFANISTKGLDETVKILVGATDLYDDLSTLGSAVSSGSASSIGSALSQLLSQWSAITGGCSSKACNMVDGILRILQAVASDVTPCEAALQPAVANLTAGMSSLVGQDFNTALAEISSGLDAVAQALDNDACGLKSLADVIVAVVPKLSSAVVKVENSNTVHILVGSADLYDTLYQAAMAIDNSDWTGFGMQMGRLLQQLRGSGCSTKACDVLQALLATAQLAATDFEACAKDADSAWADFSNAVDRFQSKSWGSAVSDLAYGFGRIAAAVNDCGVPDLAKTLENTATKLGAGTVANDIGEVVQVLVQGADITTALSQAVADFNNAQWNGFGNDLTNLAQFLDSAKCSTFVCKVLEGVLDITGTAFKDLVPCETDLKNAEKQFVSGAQSMAKGDVGSGLSSFAAGLNTVSVSVSDCGLQTELAFIQQEAQVFGFGNVSSLNGVAQVIIHGADFYHELYETFENFENHDYRAAGQTLGDVMNTLAQWTEGHACTSNFCYAVLGVLQFMGDIEGSIKECEADFENAWSNFTAAVDSFGDSHHNIIFHWTHDKDAIDAGVKDLGNAFGLVAQGVSDCQLEAFAKLLAELATKLGIAPEVSWIEEVLHIIIEGVDIEKEVDAACNAYGNDEWVKFGWELASLIKTLL